MRYCESKSEIWKPWFSDREGSERLAIAKQFSVISTLQTGPFQLLISHDGCRYGYGMSHQRFATEYISSIAWSEEVSSSFIADLLHQHREKYGVVPLCDRA